MCVAGPAWGQRRGIGRDPAAHTVNILPKVWTLKEKNFPPRLNPMTTRASTGSWLILPIQAAVVDSDIDDPLTMKVSLKKNTTFHNLDRLRRSTAALCRS